MATKQAAECREVEFPSNCKTNKAKKKHKELVLQNNPDVLFTDFTMHRGKRIKNNFIFHTDYLSEWKSVLCKHYDHICKEGIGRGGRLIVCENENLDTDNPELTITYYTKGTILVQGNENGLNSFEENFPQLKAEALKEKPLECHNTQTREGMSTGTPAPASPSSSNRKLEESLTVLELEFTEFKELMRARLNDSPYESIRHLTEELQQLKMDTQTSISELRGTIQSIREENKALRAQIAKVKEDAANKERVLLKEITWMKEEMETKKTVLIDIQEQKHTDTNTHTNTEVHHHTPSTSDKPTFSKPETDNSHLPDTPNKHAQSRTEHFTLATNSTETHSQTEPSAHGHTTAVTTESLPTSQSNVTLDSKVVLLTDSNGKFLNPEKLFPGQRASIKRCSNTKQALRLLNPETLGRPHCIIIHTGTNDLPSQHHRTAGAMRKMAETASKEFPDSRIVISTLLPRTDFPPHIIHEVNADLTRSCLALPNVHVAHHPSITPRDLYDGLHLHKDGIRAFARTLKDVALGRNRANVQPHPPYFTRYPPQPYMQSNIPFTSWSPPSRHSRPPSQHMATHPKPNTGKKKPTSTGAQKLESSKSYAAVVARPPPAPHQSSELGEIKVLLHKLCESLLK